MTAYSTVADVRGQLEQTAGVNPSDDWLNACQAHLRLTNEESADAVLHQVLYADLRDVVRSSVSSSSASSPAAAALLRNAMQDSMRGDARKATLPSTFAIMVQVEELLDVSKNADARYSIGPASASNPTPVGNQKARCLKMYLSDGHRPPIHLVAMETTPIPNLSVNSLAGIKVLLKGPLTIRHGMVQLHPGCATVLGGSVADLVVVQKKALEQAQRLAGIGVDPTVKALIWNKDAIEDEIQEEQGEGSSGDVNAPPPRAPQAQQQAPPRMAPPHPQNPARVIPRQPPQQQPPSAPPPPRHAFGAPPPVQPQQRQRIISSNNRAQTSSTVASSSSRSINPYARSSSTANSSNPAPVRAAPVPVPNPAPSISRAVVSQTPKENRSAKLPARLPPPSSAATNVSSTKSMTTQSSQESSTSTVGGIKEPMSFDELIALVKRMVQDRQLYEQHVDKIFVVPAKMKGAHTYFNIEKKKKTAKSKKSKGGEKYEYVMNSHFTGPTASKSELITVVAASDILRPHFTLPPGDMRNLSREDRQQSQKFVEEGGRKAMVELSTLRSWEINLYATAEEFFAKLPLSLDGEVPILRVLKQSD